MFCPQCGKQLDAVDLFCRWCGHSLSGEKPAQTQIAPGSVTTGPPTAAGQPVRRSGEATASLILGLFSFIPIVGLLAVIFGHMAKASIRRTGGRLLGDGMAALGLFLGYVGLFGWLAYGASIIVHPLLPSTLREQNRRLVVGSLRTISTAATTYSTMYDHGYPASLAALWPPPGKPDYKTGDLSENAAGLIDEILASGTEDNYRFTYSPGSSSETVVEKLRGMGVNVGPRIDTYTVHADPTAPNEIIHFFMDESGVIRMEVGKPASKESAPIASE